jgi:hypothetical protein
VQDNRLGAKNIIFWDNKAAGNEVFGPYFKINYYFGAIGVSVLIILVCEETSVNTNAIK